LYRAAEVPAELAEIGADVAGIALRIAEEGNQNLLGDAVTAGLLAEAGARAAGALVAINLKQMPGDDLHRRAVEAVARSAECAGRVRRRVES
jgi:formiminotetrahydrofolate cyclodeaminase